MDEHDEKAPTLKKTHNRTPAVHIGCTLTKNRSSWCNAFCEPHDGRGACGRIAPHAIRGRTQRAIDKFKQECAEQGC